MDLLPKFVRDVVDLVGLPAAMALVNAYPGLRLKVPFGLRESHVRTRLAGIMGTEAADTFIAVYAGNDLLIPRCADALRAARNQAIIGAYDRGEKSVSQLALDYSLTDRQIRSILKCGDSGQAVAGLGQRVDDNQLALF